MFTALVILSCKYVVVVVVVVVVHPGYIIPTCVGVVQVRVLRLMRILAKTDKDASESLNDILAQVSLGVGLEDVWPLLHEVIGIAGLTEGVVHSHTSTCMHTYFYKRQ